MDVFLVRHGEATSDEEDPRRPLTAKGRAEAERSARFAASAGVRVKGVFHSGKLRAEETAQIMSRHLNTGVYKTQGLLPMDDPAVWADELKNAEDSIMLVGHLPHLKYLASLLLTGKRDRVELDLATGGVVCLRKGDDAWVLGWMVEPQIIP